MGKHALDKAASSRFERALLRSHTPLLVLFVIVLVVGALTVQELFAPRAPDTTVTVAEETPVTKSASFSSSDEDSSDSGQSPSDRVTRTNEQKLRLRMTNALADYPTLASDKPVYDFLNTLQLATTEALSSQQRTTLTYANNETVAQFSAEEDPPTRAAQQPASPKQNQLEDNHRSDDEPSFDDDENLQSVAGLVLDTRGEALSDIELRIEPSRAPLTRVRDSAFEVFSDYDGSYVFDGLLRGEYTVSVAPQGRYAGARLRVRTGVDFATIVLDELHTDFSIYGRVVDEQGVPLSDVTIGSTLGGPGVRTDAGGSYRFSLPVPRRSNPIFVMFSRDGYKPFKTRITESSWRDADSLSVDVSMESLRTMVVASGQVVGEGGEAVTGAIVQLYSQTVGKLYRTTTGSTGAFAISAVGTADDYVLRVYPRLSYEDYVRERVHVSRDEQALNVQLERRNDYGVLSGEMVDANGNPVPGVRLSVSSGATRAQSLTVSGDDDGMFELNNVPAGKLTFKSLSMPAISVSGIALNQGVSEHVTLTLDLGEYELRGTIVDEDELGVPAREIYLTSTHIHSGIKSWSSRKTAADASGEFIFTGLGPGPHTLLVRSPGFLPKKVQHDVDLEDEVHMVLTAN